MTRGEAIDILVNATYSEEWQGNEKLTTAHLMAIEALEGVCFDEWCTDCKEYDTEKKCCPRFNRVIRGAMKREPSDDGTLEVKVEDATKVGRVLISDDRHRGGLYYPDEDEPQSVSFENDTKIKSCSKDSDLISRADAIEAITETLDAIDHVPKWVFDKLTSAIDILPSADRSTDGDLISRAEAIEAIELVDWYHQNKNKDMVHGANSDEHQAWYKADDVYKALEAVPTADRPKGHWIERERCYDVAECSVCGRIIIFDADDDSFCPNCGADMRSE